jgi:hypothetical protein
MQRSEINEVEKADASAINVTAKVTNKIMSLYANEKIEFGDVFNIYQRGMSYINNIAHFSNDIVSAQSSVADCLDRASGMKGDLLDNF